MKHILLTIVCVAIVLVTTADAEAKEWRGIVPLRSTRTEVEKILGSPATDPLTGSCRCLYQSEEIIVHVFYASDHPCDENQDGKAKGWRVPADTVVEIVVSFRKDQPLSDFKIDEKYEKEVDKHVPGLTYYTNRDEGVRIEAGKFTVSSVSYFPAAKDKHLRCRKKLDKAVCSL